MITDEIYFIQTRLFEKYDPYLNESFRKVKEYLHKEEALCRNTIYLLIKKCLLHPEKERPKPSVTTYVMDFDFYDNQITPLAVSIAHKIQWSFCEFTDISVFIEKSKGNFSTAFIYIHNARLKENKQKT